jgi:hypothetical protein
MKKTIEFIVKSAKNANIPSSNLYIVVGENATDTNIEKKNDYNIAFCRFVNIDYNGILYFTQTNNGLTELKKYTHFFYIHDTCVFLPCFWENMQKYALTCNQYIKIKPYTSKNIGLFNVSWFIENKKELLNYFINYEISLKLNYKAGLFTNTNEIYAKYNNLPKWLNEDALFLFTHNFTPLGDVFPNNVSITYFANIYSNQKRLATVYKEPGIIKYQKNWDLNEQTPWNLSL